MRPKARLQDLPTTHNIVNHLHNEFVRWLAQLKEDIDVYIFKYPTKAVFLGVTAHWINVKRKEGEEMWEMRSEVISVWKSGLVQFFDAQGL